MGGFLEKLGAFFAEEENWLTETEPVTRKGRKYIPYSPKSDEDSVWPNTYCSGCGHLELKKKMYFNPEEKEYFHPRCLKEE